MTGLSPQQLIEVTTFIQKHHKFGYVKDADKYEGHEGYCIKYIDACYDSRQGDYWSISFRGMGKINFNTNAFAVVFGPEKPKDFNYASLYDWIMDFLMYKWVPKAKVFDFMSGDQKMLENFPSEMAKEWTDMDMINCYCADLEDGRTTQDTLDACKWIINYRETMLNGKRK